MEDFIVSLLELEESNSKTLENYLNKINFSIFVDNNNREDLQVLDSYISNPKLHLDYLIDKYGEAVIDRLNKNISNHYKRTSRIKDHIAYMSVKYKYLYFFTLTFNEDDQLKDKKILRDLIFRFLNKIQNQYDGVYIANVDYGTINNTVHYHATVGTNIELPLISYKAKNKKGKFQTRYTLESIKWRGILDIESVSNSKFDAISKYLDKLCNHCKKDSTNNEKLIYSRKFKDYEYHIPTKVYSQLFRCNVSKGLHNHLKKKLKDQEERYINNTLNKK